MLKQHNKKIDARVIALLNMQMSIALKFSKLVEEVKDIDDLAEIFRCSTFDVIDWIRTNLSSESGEISNNNLKINLKNLEAIEERLVRQALVPSNTSIGITNQRMN